MAIPPAGTMPASPSPWHGASLWLDEQHPTYPALEADQQTDVVIIGSGISGASTAYWLTRAGYRPLVLEERGIATGASGRNAGFLLSGTAENYSRVVASFGKQQARELWDFTATNHSLLKETLVAERINCAYRPCGSLLLASSASEWDEVQESVALLRDDGQPAQLLTPDDLPPVLRDGDMAGRYRGAAYYPFDAEIQPAVLTHALLKISQVRGTRICERSRVVALEPDGQSWRLHVQTSPGLDHRSGVTREFTVTAGTVILATNAYTPQLWPTLGGAIRPVRGQVCATAPLSRRILDAPCYANQGYEYWRQSADLRLVVGGWRYLDIPTEVGYTEETNPMIQDHLERFAHALAQAGGAASVPPITHRWSGTMAFTQDGLPMIGRLPASARVLLAAGYTGHGMAYAFHAGRVLADLVNGVDTPLCPLFSPTRMIIHAYTPGTPHTTL